MKRHLARLTLQEQEEGRRLFQVASLVHDQLGLDGLDLFVDVMCQRNPTTPRTDWEGFARLIDPAWWPLGTLMRPRGTP